MSIVFHCNHCGKKVEAPDSSGGKWGKCPSCHSKLYIPGVQADEELKLAPMDESDEERKRRLMAETHRLTQDILQEKEVPNGPAKSTVPLSEMSQKELTKNIILYLRQMTNGDLDDAQRTADLIAPYGKQAIEILDRIALSEIPEPELADIPSQVLSGFIRNLRTRIS
jgi:DNA-directed RNA polymerase subunit RPC12/RpoP